MGRIRVKRTHHRLLADPRRVLARRYLPSEAALVEGRSRANLLVERIMEIPEARLQPLVDDLLKSFSSRHRDFELTLEEGCQSVARWFGVTLPISVNRRLLIGAYFTHEYSVEAAALFNPSIVLAPDQSDLAAGQRRFIMSLRAVGEGHLSSIEFRSGVLDVAGNLNFDLPGKHLLGGHRTPPLSYHGHLFRHKLIELGAWNDVARKILLPLPDSFTLEQLESSLAALDGGGESQAMSHETAKLIRVLAASNYVVNFPSDSTISQRVLFPAGPNETQGMEDARFVRFVDGDETKYFATYTAYDGFQIVPQLIETEDFVTFEIATLNGEAAQNKGMAMFPRKIGGEYMMLSRKDRANLHLTHSNNVRFWNDVAELHRPSQPWELLQIGNCGAPIETEAGWLVLTHGVGPMRQYAIGALLLDLEDPLRVIGYLREPLLAPNASEREGYVPNVLYTCGALINGDELVMPYGFSDAGIGVAMVAMDDLLEELSSAGP